MLVSGLGQLNCPAGFREEFDPDGSICVPVVSQDIRGSVGQPFAPGGASFVDQVSYQFRRLSGMEMLAIGAVGLFALTFLRGGRRR